MEAKVTRYIIIFINVVFVLIAGINIMELVDILVYKEFYPFGTEFFSPYSIYKSKEIYLTFKAVFTALIIVMLICSALKFRKAFWFFAFLNICLALYTYLSI
jgi:hypothetical protein